MALLISLHMQILYCLTEPWITNDYNSLLASEKKNRNGSVMYLRIVQDEIKENKIKEENRNPRVTKNLKLYAFNVLE